MACSQDLAAYKNQRDTVDSSLSSESAHALQELALLYALMHMTKHKFHAGSTPESPTNVCPIVRFPYTKQQFPTEPPKKNAKQQAKQNEASPCGHSFSSSKAILAAQSGHVAQTQQESTLLVDEASQRESGRQPRELKRIFRGKRSSVRFTWLAGGCTVGWSDW